MYIDEAERVLGLEAPYTAVDLVKAFRKKSLLTHPDVGGKTEDFLLVKRAKELLGRILAGEQISSDEDDDLDPEDRWQEESRVPSPESRATSHERRATSHEPRTEEPPWADDGWVDGEEDEEELGQWLGKKLAVLHVEIDGRAHPAPRHFRAWVELCGKRRDQLAIAFQPPAPIRFVSFVECVAVFDGDELGDAVGLSGRVVERSHDEDSMVTMFCVDPFGGA